jgi:hypothetical protein
MSSPRSARTSAARRAKPAHPASETASAAALRLAATVEHGLAEGQLDVLTPEALQALMAATCKTYAAQIEAGGRYMPLASRSGVNDTTVMLTASALLRAANLEVFELGMWQSWTGR